MKFDPKIYREAFINMHKAKRLTDSFCCTAIKRVSDVRYINEFENWFMPEGETAYAWYGPRDRENQLARQLALLLMEQIVKDEK